jgi:hypothetical protein
MAKGLVRREGKHDGQGVTAAYPQKAQHFCGVTVCDGPNVSPQESVSVSFVYLFFLLLHARGFSCHSRHGKRFRYSLSRHSRHTSRHNVAEGMTKATVAV